MRSKKKTYTILIEKTRQIIRLRNACLIKTFLRSQLKHKKFQFVSLIGGREELKL